MRISTNEPDNPGRIILQTAATPHTIRYRKLLFSVAGFIKVRAIAKALPTINEIIVAADHFSTVLPTK
jgi:hypothetical protein